MLADGLQFAVIADVALVVIALPDQRARRATHAVEPLDAFCDAMLAIAREAEEDPDLVRGAPHTAPLRRLDEATAARKPVLRWTPPAP